jgi:hypothetical protein
MKVGQGPNWGCSAKVSNTQSVKAPWTGDQSVSKPLCTRRKTQNKRIQTSIPLVRFEPMTPVFERAKTVHDSERATTVIGRNIRLNKYIYI